MTDDQVNALAVRRPIFDRQQRVVAYQILVRGDVRALLPSGDADPVPHEEPSDAWSTTGLATLTGSKKMCINLSGGLLATGVARIFPRGSAVVTLTGESIEPPEDVGEEWQTLQAMGHLLAFEYRHGADPPRFVSTADIVKVPFPDADTEEKYHQVRQVVGDRPRLLATQVDTHDEYAQAVKLGFSFAQGEFFCEPEIQPGSTISGYRLSHFKLLEAGNRPDLKVDEINTIIESDLTITHRFLKYLGAAALGFRTEIRSVRHGLALLGQRRIRSFVSLAALAGMCEEKPHELLVTGAVRGKFCERIGSGLILGDRASEFFLLGSLSLIDTMLDQPMKQLLEKLPLANDLKRALLGGESALRPALEFVTSYERGDWLACDELGRTHRIAAAEALHHYTEAVAWATAALEA